MPDSGLCCHRIALLAIGSNRGEATAAEQQQSGEKPEQYRLSVCLYMPTARAAPRGQDSVWLASNATPTDKS